MGLSRGEWCILSGRSGVWLGALGGDTTLEPTKPFTITIVFALI